MINNGSLLYCFALLFFLYGCNKKNGSAILVEETQPEYEEKITFHKTDRDDIPLMPEEQWWTIDTSALDTCQKAAWTYLKSMYPIYEENDNDYQIYTLKGQSGDVWENRAFIESYHTFFSQSFWKDYLLNENLTCRETLDTTFFQQSIGEPTCEVLNERDNQITYFYYLKLRYRKGPCPHTRYNGVEYAPNLSCYTLHFQYCAMLRVVFSQDDGKLDYIDFIDNG
ncbi:MAG: hypothetical protein MI974_22420 [Chitinophagales bacterium]|nr:hypothetical protein [Chitinophagales bacterium]